MIPKKKSKEKERDFLRELDNGITLKEQKNLTILKEELLKILLNNEKIYVSSKEIDTLLD